jgi:hypothetical protein
MLTTRNRLSPACSAPTPPVALSWQLTTTRTYRIADYDIIVDFIAPRTLKARHLIGVNCMSLSTGSHLLGHTQSLSINVADAIGSPVGGNGEGRRDDCIRVVAKLPVTVNVPRGAVYADQMRFANGVQSLDSNDGVGGCQVGHVIAYTERCTVGLAMIEHYVQIRWWYDRLHIDLFRSQYS